MTITQLTAVLICGIPFFYVILVAIQHGVTKMALFGVIGLSILIVVAEYEFIKCVREGLSSYEDSVLPLSFYRKR